MAEAARSASDRAGTRYHVPNLERALTILEHLAEHPEGKGMSELADGLSLPRNSVFRIASTLQDHGYLQRDEGSKRFSLTPKLLSLGYAALGEQAVVEKSLDVMRDLRDATRETALVGTLVGAEGLVLEQVPSLHPVKFLVDGGTRFPLHTGAPGKAMLAYLPGAEQRQRLRGLRLKRFTANTITNRRALRAALGEARRRGYAVDRAEQMEGLHCVAAPILDHRAYPIASLWVTAPASRMPVASFAAVAEQVKAHALRIAQRFGYPGDALARPAEEE